MSTNVHNPKDSICSLAICSRIFAQVDCIKYIMQGTSNCIDIQLFGLDEKPLDLTKFSTIQIQLINEIEAVVANFWYPTVPSGAKGFDLEILQYNTTSGNTVNKGLIRICLPTNATYTTPGSIFAEILLKEDLVTGEDELIDNSFGVPCFYVAKILESKIAKNGGEGGAFPGYIPPLPGGSGIGFAIGSTGATGARGDTEKVLTFTVGDSSPITAGEKVKTRICIPYNGTITSWFLMADVSTTAVIDIWKATGAVPTNSDSITASAKPTLSAQIFTNSSSLIGWAPHVSIGDIMVIEVESNNNATYLNLMLTISQ